MAGRTPMETLAATVSGGLARAAHTLDKLGVDKLWASRNTEYIALDTVGDGDDMDEQPQRQWNPPNRGRWKRYLWLLVLVPLVLVLLLVGNHTVKRGPPPLAKPMDVEMKPDTVFAKMDLTAHNEATLTRLRKCRDLNMLARTADPGWTRSEEDERAAEKEGCGRNATTLVILSSFWLSEAKGGSLATGETVYAASAVAAVRESGYAHLYRAEWFGNADMTKTLELYHEWHDIVRLVIADPEQVNDCFGREGCIKTKSHSDGIPSWRLLSFWYWDEPGSPLGREFTLSPSPTYKGNTLLSYSIEPMCDRLTKVPTAERRHPPQVYLLAKHPEYFNDVVDGPNSPGKSHGYFTWTLKIIKHAGRKLKVQFAGGMNALDNDDYLGVMRAGVKNYGPLNVAQFYSEVAQSVVMSGVGRPRISPSPWDALCLGVPFINPILKWDKKDPMNRAKWEVQQSHMIDMEPPYVYHVHAKDGEGYEKALAAAIANPIESYVPETMKYKWIVARVAAIIEDDWRARGERVIAELHAAGEHKDIVL